jgi:hypothetical protein
MAPHQVPAPWERSNATAYNLRSAVRTAPGSKRGIRVRSSAAQAAASAWGRVLRAPGSATSCSRRFATQTAIGRAKASLAVTCATRAVVLPVRSTPSSATLYSLRSATPMACGRTSEHLAPSSVTRAPANARVSARPPPSSVTICSRSCVTALVPGKTRALCVPWSVTKGRVPLVYPAPSRAMGCNRSSAMTRARGRVWGTSASTSAITLRARARGRVRLARSSAICSNRKPAAPRALGKTRVTPASSSAAHPAGRA